MDLNLPLLLVVLTALCGVVWLIDRCFFKAAREAAHGKEPWWVDYARSFFPVFLAVLVIRSFIFQLYRVPTGSLVPTVLPGDWLFVTQYSYGLKLPVLDTKIIPIGEPKIGDIAVFKYPPNPSVTYVKRIIGLPGDHIIYKDRQLTINGTPAPQTIVGDFNYSFPNDRSFLGQVREESLPNVKHQILIDQEGAEDTVVYDFIVPQGYYFAMGDNRDDSADSRFWGFVPEANLIGKAHRIVFSWDGQAHRLRFSRIGSGLHS